MTACHRGCHRTLPKQRRETIRYSFRRRQHGCTRHRCCGFITRSIAINNNAALRWAERSGKVSARSERQQAAAFSRPMHNLDISRIVACSTPPVYLSILPRKMFTFLYGYYSFLYLYTTGTQGF